MAVTKRYPHQIVVMTDEPLNTYVRFCAEQDEVSIAEVARRLMERGRAAEQDERDEALAVGV